MLANLGKVPLHYRPIWTMLDLGISRKTEVVHSLTCRKELSSRLPRARIVRLQFAIWIMKEMYCLQLIQLWKHPYNYR